jgi:glutaconate CoA-transferase subunit A
MFDVVAEGSGPLFMDPDADKAREFFRTKTRAMTNKVMTVSEAVDAFVHDEDYLITGGFGADRIPSAVCHEIVRQRRKNLIFAGHTSTHDFQILAAGEVFDRCDIAYVIGLEARGLSPNGRRYMESGKVQSCEWTNYAMACRLKAAAAGVSFMPARNLMGTDTFKHSAAKIVECPFSGARYVLHPALFPDVAAIHVHEADIYGNSRIKGISVADIEMARAAKRVIITTERLVPNDVIRQNPSATQIPFYQVDAVCEVPFGSYPGNMPYEYFSDEEHLRLWMKTEKDPEEFKAFLDKYIYGVKDFNTYIELCGGVERISQLRAEENLIDIKGGGSGS